MKYLLIFFLIITFTEKAYSKDCKDHPIYCKIVQLQPSIDKEWAMELSDIIYKESKLSEIDPFISVAILKQENSFQNKNTFKEKVTTQDYCENNKCFKKVIKISEVVDMTIAQINITTAANFDFDIERLYNLDDVEYAIECHMKILKKKMNVCKDLKDLAWTCYHSYTEEFRLIYLQDVSRWL